MDMTSKSLLKNYYRSTNICRCIEKRFVSNLFAIGRGGSLIPEFDHENEYILDEYQRVIIAVGANIGDRFDNLMKGIDMLKETKCSDLSYNTGDKDEITPLIRIIRTSYLRETAPMYVTDQPSFLNGAVEIETKLSPLALLRRLKNVESQIGRDLNGKRNGPRLIDLDIIYFGIRKQGNENIHGGIIVQSDELEVPHPRIAEREFVLSPLCDIDKNIIHPSIGISTKAMLELLNEPIKNSILEDNQSNAVQVIPLPRGRMISFNETHIMGILNVTPDSFSDGGKYHDTVDLAVKRALQMVLEGASIIDIGGESTRPGAEEMSIDVEIERTIPVIKKMREVSDIPISIDTRHSEVAKAAVLAGADIVNDVSGGTHDPLMLKTVKELRVPIILMHMRGNPKTMQQLAQYNDVVGEVSSSLLDLSKKAEGAGIPRWMQVLDPGIGFAKNIEHNLSLLQQNVRMRGLINECPLLLGPSRKRFIGEITGEEVAENRDFGTLAACLFGLFQNENGKIRPTILRVHNVKGIKHGVQVYEAILRANKN